MNRRSFLGRSGAVLLLTAGRLDGKSAGNSSYQGDSQPPSRRAAEPPSQADRLYDPSVVQERARVTAADNDPAVKALEHQLKCTCGCNLDIYTCRTTDFTCTYSPALHQEVLGLKQSGKSDAEIIDAFVAKYGEKILMAPKPEGFNLAGYLLPGLLVLTVALVLAWVLVRRSRRSEALPAVQPSSRPAVQPSSAADEERLRAALAEVED